MFKYLSIQARNILLACVVMLGLLTVNLTANFFNSKEQRLITLKYEMGDIKEDILNLRKYEKDFLMRDDLKYQDAFAKTVITLQEEIVKLKAKAIAEGIILDELDKLTTIVQKYKSVFDEIVEQKKKIGFTHNEGLEGKLRQSIHKVENSLKDQKNDKLENLILTLRRDEKDFMLRLDPSYKDEFVKNYEKASLYIQKNNQENDLVTSLKHIEMYRDSFIELVNAYEILGFDENNGLLSQLRATVHKTDELILSAIKQLSLEFDEHMSFTHTAYILIDGAVIIVILAMILLIIRSIMLPLRVLTKAIVSNERDLTMKYETPYNDELKEIADALNEFMGRLRKIVLGAINASDENAAVAHELSSTSNNIGKRAEEESKIVEQTTITGNQAKVQIEESVVSSKEAKEGIEKTNNALLTTNQTFALLIDKIEQTARVESDLQAKMDALSNDADKVKDVLNVINDIADQTNLLALNAAIEAARAGEHGRGFAVVADEVRLLAERTQKSLVEINATVSIIVQAIRDSGSQMDENAKLFEDLVKQSAFVSQKVNDSVDSMQNSITVVERATQMSEKSGNEIKKAMDEINHINQITSSNARDLEEIAAAADHLHSVTQKLNDQLHYFKV